MSFHCQYCDQLKKNLYLFPMQVKDEVNAGNLLYKLGKVEFENVYFSYISG